jgi:hypothetical protein
VRPRNDVLKMRVASSVIPVHIPLTYPPHPTRPNYMHRARFFRPAIRMPAALQYTVNEISNRSFTHADLGQLTDAVIDDITWSQADTLSDLEAGSTVRLTAKQARTLTSINEKIQISCPSVARGFRITPVRRILISAGTTCFRSWRTSGIYWLASQCLGYRLWIYSNCTIRKCGN